MNDAGLFADLFARQVRRQRAAIDLPLAHCDRLGGGLLVLLRRGFGRRDSLLQVLERERHLFGIEALLKAYFPLSASLTVSLMPPMAFCTLPSILLALPSASSLASPVAWKPIDIRKAKERT